MPDWAPKLGRRNGPLYLAIVNALADDIHRGRLRPGERIPTHRALAAQLGIDFTTVSRAYSEARRRGLVVGQGGRGTFVRDAPAERDGGPARLVDLSLNVPAEPSGEDVGGELAHALGLLATDPTIGRLVRYAENEGAADHREAGAVWLGGRGLEADPERIVVCSGAQHGIAVVLASLGVAGKVILAEGLTFPAMRPLAQYLGARLVGVALDEHGLRPDALEQACRTHQAVALCTVPTLQNPTASIMPAERRREIAGIARKHGLFLVEDDVYGSIPTDVPTPLSAYAPELSYYVASLSKSVAPGLRVAYALAPDGRGATQVASATRATLWMVAPLLVEIAARWIRDGTASRIARARREEATARYGAAVEELGPRLTRAHPYGYHAWLELPPEWPTAEFVAGSRRRGVAVSPSDAFAVDPSFAIPAVRVCLGQAVSGAELSRALAVLAAMLDGHPDTTNSLF